jgi:phosphatidylglycerophosphatase A
VTLTRFIASGFGAGYAPVAPGTFGSLVGLILGAVLLRVWPPGLPLAALVATLFGLWAISKIGGGDDPGWITIDEIAGQLLAMLPLASPSPLGLIAALALFRLLDITKPGPVGWVDRQHGPAGVMGDDVIAGLIAAGILWAVQQKYPMIFA